VEAVAHFLPESGAAEAALDRFVEAGLVVDALEAQAVDDVFVDRFREGFDFWKTMPTRLRSSMTSTEGS
jgi:hypothetical protein